MNILVGYDGSKVAADALELAKKHAKAFNAKVFIVTSMVGGPEVLREDFEKAEKEYLATLAIKTDAPEALNNLAWLYATSEDKKLRKPQEALKLALKAVRLNPKPYILDTLAESYFINGLYKEAVETSKLAIAQNPKDMSHHKKQLKRFEEHLRKEQEKRKRLSEGTYISI